MPQWRTMSSPSRSSRPPRRAVAVLTVTALGATFTACADAERGTPLDQARAVNDSRHVAEAFDERPVVIDDTKGLASLQYFFATSETLVVSDATLEAQLRAASIAVAAHAPMIVYDPAQHQEISHLVQQLRTHTVLTVGDVNLARTSGRVRVNRDPGGTEAIEAMFAMRFREEVVETPEKAAAAVAGLDPNKPTWLRAAWADPQVKPGAEAKPFPMLSRRDASMAPVVVATPESSIASVANARSFGADVDVVYEPDPRDSELTLFTMAGLAAKPLVALGAQFGTSAELSHRILQAEDTYDRGRRAPASGEH